MQCAEYFKMHFLCCEIYAKTLNYIDWDLWRFVVLAVAQEKYS